MEEKKTIPQNFILRLLEFKREMRKCIQNGADYKEMQSIADTYGFKFAKPL